MYTSDILVEERRGLHGWIALGYYGLKPYGTEDDKWRPDNAQEVMDKLQLQVTKESAYCSAQLLPAITAICIASGRSG